MDATTPAEQMPPDDAEAGVIETSPHTAGMGRDLVWTTLTTVAMLLGNVVIASLLAHRGAADVFGPFNLVKRISAGLLPFLTLGLTVGVVRSIAAAAGERERDAHRAAAVALSLGTTLAAGLVCLLAPGPVSSLLLGVRDPALLLALWLYSLSLVVNGLAYSFYRAELQQGRANVINISQTLLPLAVLALAPASWSAVRLLDLAAALVIAWSGGAMLLRVLAGAGALARPRELVASGRAMLAYSLPRVPGGVALGFTLAIGPMAANRAGEALVASHLLAALAFAQLAGAALQSFGVVLLPRVAGMHAEGEHDRIGRLASALIAFGVGASVIGSPLLAAVAGDVVRLWLGAGFAAAVPAFRVVAAGIPPLVLYVLLRSVLDGAVKAPVTTYATVAGFAVTAALSFAMPHDVVTLAAAYSAGQWVTGAWAVVAAMRLGGKVALGHAAACAAAGVALGAAVYLGGPMLGVSAAAAVARVALAVVLALAGIAGALWIAPRELGLREALRARAVAG